MHLAEFMKRTDLPLRQVQRLGEQGVLASAPAPGSGNYRDYTEEDVLVARVINRVRIELGCGRGQARPASTQALRAVAEMLRDIPDPTDPGKWLILSFDPTKRTWRPELFDAGAETTADFILADSTRHYLLLRLDEISPATT